MADWVDVPLQNYDGNVQKFLDFIGKAEGADYNTIVGGGKFDNYSQHPNVVGLRTAEGPSTAAGKYQILNSTYKDVAPSLGINDFSPDSQDRIALELIKRAGALGDVQSGNYQAAVKKLGNTWASLPSSPYSQPKRSTSWVEKALDTFVSPAQAATNDGGWQDASSLVADKASGDGGGWQDYPVDAAPAAPVAAQPTQEAPAKKTLTDVGMSSDPTWIANAKRLYKETQGKDFKGQDAEAADWLKNYVAQTNWNLAGTAGTIYDATTKLSPEGKQALLQSIQAYEAAPTSFESVGRAAKGIITDPTTWLTGGVGGLITKTLGRKAAAEGVKQAIKSGLEKELVTAATKKAVGTGAAYGAINDLGKQGVEMSANGRDSIDLGQTGTAATVGGVTGGTLNKLVDKVTGRAAVRDFVKGMGTEEQARVKAEVAKDFADIAQNPRLKEVNDQGQATVATKLRNVQNTSYVKAVEDALKITDPEVLKKYDVVRALKNREIITPDKLDAIRQSPNGNILADAIEKAQTAATLTAPKPASGSLGAKLTRGAIVYGPKIAASTLGYSGGGPLGILAGAVIPSGSKGFAERLTGKLTVPEAIQKLSSQGNVEAADKVLAALGQSKAAQGTEQVANLARQAQAQSTARAQAQAQARAAGQAMREQATQAGEQLRIRNLQLGIRSNPKFKPDADIGGGTRGTLQYYGRLADSKELAKGLKIIEKTDPYLAPYIASIKQNKGVPDKGILLGLSDRLLKLRDEGILKPYIK